MKKYNVAVITGGDSSECKVSLKSSKKIFKSVDANLFTPYEISIIGQNWLVISHDSVVVDKSDFSFFINNQKITIDVAFLILHGAPAENGKLQAYFDLIDIPYTGSGHMSSAISFNKFVCNNYLRNFDLNIAKSIVLFKNQKVDVDKILEQITLPCFVKPNEAGSSFGISKVTKVEQFNDAINKAFDEDSSIMIEEYIEGLELTNGIFKIDNEITVLPITEVSTENDFFDFEAKYSSGKAEEITPARIPLEIELEIKEKTKLVYEALFCEGIVRVDYILKGNKVFFLEANSIPGMTETSFIPQQIASAGLDFNGIINKLILAKV